jgi:phytoene dehydrogenase-like protein
VGARRSDRSVDALVVGAGHNGLVGAAYLAKAGLSVLVCERRDVVGGAAVTEELKPGFRVSTASYALSLFRPDVYADLELRRHGLEVVAKDPQMFVPLPDGEHFFVWRDAARTREEIARLSPADADGYARWGGFWDEAVDALRPLVEDPEPPELSDVEQAVGPDVWRWAVAGSAAETVEHFFSHPGVQGAFASQGVIGTWRSPRDTGTAWVMAYHALGGELCGRSGVWGFVRGGMGALTQALRSSAEEAGAEVRCGIAVDELLVDDGAVAGVRLADGSVVRTGLVVSGADPKTTFLRLVPPGALDREFIDRVDAWQTPGCVLKVNLALSELPDFRALPGSAPGPQHFGTVEISPSIDYLHEAWDEAAASMWSRHPFMEVFVQSAVDPTLVDGDGHVLSAFAQYVSPEAASSWDDVREKATEAVVDTLASYAPNVPQTILACEALGPVELEARFGLSGGNIFHGEITPEQSFGHRFAHRTPVRGLYLGGSGARPGGCVMGAAGRNAARVVLADLGRD